MELQHTGQEGRGLRWVRHQVCVTFWGIGEWFRLSSFSSDLHFLLVWHHRACRQCWSSALPFLQISHTSNICIFIYSLNYPFCLEFHTKFSPLSWTNNKLYPEQGFTISIVFALAEIMGMYLKHNNKPNSSKRGKVWGNQTTYSFLISSFLYLG